MIDNIKKEDIIEKKVDSTSEETEKTEEVKTETVEQDPLKIELEKVQKRSKYTEKEKAEHSLKKTAERVKELGGDPNSILGITTVSTEEELDGEDEKPVTVGMLKKIQQENASKTALQEADDIENETERELVKFHLHNTIKSTGVPAEDLKLARALVNAVKNTQIIKEVTRKTPPKTHSNGSGGPAKDEKEVVFTPEEQSMIKAPFNMTPNQVLEARAGKNFKFKTQH